MTAAGETSTIQTTEERESAGKLMGLVVFGEMVAARTYKLMADLRPEFATILRKFASMEGQHATWFRDTSQRNGIELDKDFADKELGYLIDQVDNYSAQKDFDALMIVQGFIVESLAIATYEPFLEIAPKYEGASAAFAQALADERYHVDWVTRYLRLRFFDNHDEFMSLTDRVNVQGIDCVGGTLMSIANGLKSVGLSAADCTGAMMDEYTSLLENVGVESRRATKAVVSLFVPLAQKYRRRPEAH